MDTLSAKIAQYKYNKEQTKEFWGSIAVVIGLALLTYLWFSIL